MAVFLHDLVRLSRQQLSFSLNSPNANWFVAICSVAAASFERNVGRGNDGLFQIPVPDFVWRSLGNP
jgi:hypothetical protein